MASTKEKSFDYEKIKKDRTNWKLDKPSFNICSNCGSPRLPHRACVECGTYKNKPAKASK